MSHSGLLSDAPHNHQWDRAEGRTGWEWDGGFCVLWEDRIGRNKGSSWAAGCPDKGKRRSDRRSGKLHELLQWWLWTFVRDRASCRRGEQLCGICEKTYSWASSYGAEQRRVCKTGSGCECGSSLQNAKRCHDLRQRLPWQCIFPRRSRFPEIYACRHEKIHLHVSELRKGDRWNKDPLPGGCTDDVPPKNRLSPG